MLRAGSTQLAPMKHEHALFSEDNVCQVLQDAEGKCNRDVPLSVRVDHPDGKGQTYLDACAVSHSATWPNVRPNDQIKQEKQAITQVENRCERASLGRAQSVRRCSLLKAKVGARITQDYDGVS